MSSPPVQATIEDVMVALKALLDTASTTSGNGLFGATIELFERTEEPGGLTVYVHPSSADQELIAIGAVTRDVMHFTVDVEIPWHDIEADGFTVMNAGLAVSDVIAANRDIAITGTMGGRHGTVGEGPIRLIQRPLCGNEGYVGLCWSRSIKYNTR
jgi:hypothetical protein